VYGRDDQVIEMTRDECWKRLRSEPIGRLATGSGLDLDLFPITYRCDGQSLYFRTSPGSKLAHLSVNPWCVLEVDGHTDEEAWSVVARGNARHLHSVAELDVAESLDLETWIPGEKRDFVRIDVVSVTGRSFARADQVSRR